MLLEIHRTVPMSGPTEGEAKTRIIGSGFKPPKSEIHIKWGIMTTEIIKKS